MRRAGRVLLVASMLVGTVGSASASFWKHAKSDKSGTEASSAAIPTMSLNAVETEASPSPRLLLRTSGTPAYTSYSPSPGVFVVDLTGTAKDAGVTMPSPLPSGLNSVSAEEVVEMGSRLTRVTLRLAQTVTPQASAEANSVVIDLPAAVAESDVSSTPAPVVEPLVVPDAIAAAATPSSVQVAETPRVIDPVVTAESLPLNKAKTLKKIETAGAGETMQIDIAGDGEIPWKAFRLTNPERIVVDLSGIRNASTRNTIQVADPLVKRIRVSQFKGAPEFVTRVVVDLDQKADFNLRQEGDRLRMTFGGAARAAAVEALAVPAHSITVTEPAVRPAEKVAVTSVVKPEPAIAQPARVEVPRVEPVQTVSAIAPADVTAQVPAIAENAPTWKMPEKASRGARQVVNASSTQMPPSKRSRQSRAAAAASNGEMKSAEDVFNDGTTAGTPQVTGSTTLGGRTLSGSEKVYTGEPLSLNLKDADIKDVLRTFATLTGLNIAVDPGVTGSVTVNFVDVPWDQALEIILRQNGLTYTIEGNVMRVGTLATISNETAANRRLQDEERLNVPLSTVSFKLSYSRAADVAALIRDIASPRAKIIVDTRTNQLIVSEIPQYLQTMRNLIDSVDVPTRQVVIEARIVETTKSFLQQYGFTWGFRGKLDPSLGTGTGLVFPNRVDVVGGPFEFGPGNPVLSLSLGNVLGTFNLDLALNAAESEGLVKVISAPRVTTQDNVAAEISSGFQIPYQTRINFTTTITYVDATLRLSVTPQITEAGTVIMQIAVQKTEPATGLAIEGGAGTPLATRQARTTLMVRDGGTSVIAGIYQTRENNSESRLPFVHQLPIIGNLFKTHNVSTTHDELLIFITPRIVRSS